MVAVLHPGDNYKDHSRLGTLSNLYGRPMQISAAISATLADPELSPYVHDEQVGVIGYSAGGDANGLDLSPAPLPSHATPVNLPAPGFPLAGSSTRLC